ncbi:hypothetical protein SAMN03080610_01649 [Afifella marina DSM 2698]|uniref:Uncharacterized protein n=1 Tax=Afifella marina DSM 2698 TaxID=1120955 RepID=A0A1G5N9T6_AFIMA|nr:hypothetical protein SAMN03080610_01649 [Afifella marina DSM 2698]
MQFAVSIVAQFDGGRFQDAAGRDDGLAQIEVNADITGKPRQIIDDDDMRIFAVGFEKGEHGQKAGPVGALPCQVVGEDTHHIIGAVFRVFAAACFLRVQPVAALGLGLARYAAIDNRLRDVMAWPVVKSHAFLPFWSLSFSFDWSFAPLNRWRSGESFSNRRT